MKEQKRIRRMKNKVKVKLGIIMRGEKTKDFEWKNHRDGEENENNKYI